MKKVYDITVVFMDNTEIKYTNCPRSLMLWNNCLQVCIKSLDIWDNEFESRLHPLFNIKTFFADERDID